MAHIGDRPLVIEFLGKGRGRVTPAQIRKLMRVAPHMHVIAMGSREEREALLKSASKQLTEGLHVASRMALQKGALSGGTLLKTRDYVAEMKHDGRAALLKGSGFWDVMKKVGSFALKALPVVAKVAPIAAAFL